MLAGGSGDDTISGGDGDDQIYGDSGVNVDIISRVLPMPTTDAARPANDNPKSNRDGLVAGKDKISGDDGDDVIFGDHGIVTQAALQAAELPGTLRLVGPRGITDRDHAGRQRGRRHDPRRD